MKTPCKYEDDKFCEDHEKIHDSVVTVKTTLKVASFFLGGILTASFIYTNVRADDIKEAQAATMQEFNERYNDQRSQIADLKQTVSEDHATTMQLVEQLKITNARLWEIIKGE